MPGPGEYRPGRRERGPEPFFKTRGDEVSPSLGKERRLEPFFRRSNEGKREITK